MRLLYTLAVALSVPAVLVVTSVFVLAQPAFLRWEYGRAGFPPTAGISDAERLSLAIPSTNYISRPGWDEGRLFALRLDGAPLYTAGEVQHLVDVRHLMRRLATVGGAAALVMVGAALIAWRRRAYRRGLSAGLMSGGALSLVMVAATALLAVVAWRLIFTGFHQVLFPPGTWQFANSSGLIRLFPEQFWFDSALALTAVVTVGALGTIGGGILLRRWL